jgi:hypothetical protein
MSCRCRVNKQESHSTPDTIGDPVWLCRGAATQKNTALRACSKEVHPRGRVTLPCFLLGRCCLYTIAHISPPYGMHACKKKHMIEWTPCRTYKMLFTAIGALEDGQPWWLAHTCDAVMRTLHQGQQATAPAQYKQLCWEVFMPLLPQCLRSQQLSATTVLQHPLLHARLTDLFHSLHAQMQAWQLQRTLNCTPAAVS